MLQNSGFEVEFPHLVGSVGGATTVVGYDLEIVPSYAQYKNWP